MLMVILGHQCEKFGAGHSLQILQTFHMPMFFLISGYFISDKSSFRSFAYNKGRRLLVPYAVSCFIAMILCSIKVMLENGVYSSIEEIKRWVWISVYASGSGCGSMIGQFGYPSEIGMLWYLVALFWGCLIVKSVINKKYSVVYILAITSTGFGTSKLFGWIPFSLQNGMGCSIWIYFGYLIKKNVYFGQNTDIIRNRVLAGLVFIAWIMSAFYGGINLFANNYSLGVIDFIGAILGSLIVFSLCTELSKSGLKIVGALSWIGKNSLLVYCIHFLEHNVVPVSNFVNKMGLNNYLASVFSWIGVVITVVTVAYFLKKLSLFRRFMYKCAVLIWNCLNYIEFSIL